MTGTISWGTLRPQDLVPRFMDALSVLDRGAYLAILNSIETPDVVGVACNEGGAMPGIDLCDDDPWWLSEECRYLLNEDLFEALNACAPEGLSLIHICRCRRLLT